MPNKYIMVIIDKKYACAQVICWIGTRKCTYIMFNFLDKQSFYGFLRTT